MESQKQFHGSRKPPPLPTKTYIDLLGFHKIVFSIIPKFKNKLPGNKKNIRLTPGYAYDAQPNI